MAFLRPKVDLLGLSTLAEHAWDTTEEDHEHELQRQLEQQKL